VNRVHPLEEVPSPEPEEIPEPAVSSLLKSVEGGTMVILKFSGWGTLLGIAPFLAELRQRAPETRQVLVTERRNAPVASRFPWPDRILYLEAPATGGRMSLPALATLALRIRAQSPALFLDLQLHTWRRTALLLGLASGAPRRVGFVRREDGPRMRFLTHPLYFNMHHPSRQAYGQAALLLGICPDITRPEALDSVLRESPADLQELERVYPSLSRPGKICVLNPNASERALERRWPAEKFSQAAERLLRRHPSLRIVLTGSAAERDYTDRVARALPPSLGAKIVNLAGQLSLGSLIALLARADVFLSNDTGPLHLALHLRTPSVGLFGPTRPDLVLDPEGLRSLSVLTEPHYCSPCLYQVSRPPCGGDNVCLSSLPVERVVREVEFRLAGGASGDQDVPSLPFRFSDGQGFPLAGFRTDRRPSR